MKEKQTFAEKHPKINFLTGLLLLRGIVIAAVLLVKWIFGVVESWIVSVVTFVENFVTVSYTHLDVYKRQMLLTRI